MTRQVVHDDDVAGGKGRREDLLDVGEDTHAVDRAVTDRWRGEARDTQDGEHRGGQLPPGRRVLPHARALEAAPIPPHEVGADATFVEKHQARRIARRRGRPPRRPRDRVRTRGPFFTPKSEALDRPAERGPTGWRAQGHLEVCQGDIRLCVKQGRQRGELRMQNRRAQTAFVAGGRSRRSHAVAVSTDRPRRD